jgi:hypothetical protein
MRFLRKSVGPFLAQVLLYIRLEEVVARAGEDNPLSGRPRRLAMKTHHVLSVLVLLFCASEALAGGGGGGGGGGGAEPTALMLLAVGATSLWTAVRR